MRRLKLIFIAAAMATVFSPVRASAQIEQLCDPGFEDCRWELIKYIRAERVGLDVAFWFMEDGWIANEIILRHQAGVPVRVLMDTEANASTPRNRDRLAELSAAGIPMRERVASGILHWKMILFSGQGIVEFSGANFSSDAWVFSGAPYTNYTDEAIYFTSDPSVVNSFRTKYDDLWTNTIQYANYANITGSLSRRHDTFAKDPALNFPPLESFFERSNAGYSAERQKIDVIIYRITDQRHTNAMIAAQQRGVPVRIITEPQQYRDPKRLWHSWNIDRLYMAGIQVRNRVHAGLNHQKLTILHGQRMTVLGSSNWTSPSDSSQEEHNYFTTKPVLFTWLVDHFERKWNNLAGVAETGPFVPQPPDAAISPIPASGALEVPVSGVTLKWDGSMWAHNYDIYFGTSANPPLLAADQMLGPSHHTADYKMFALPMTLNAGTTYYWKIVSKTMANRTATSQVFSFMTAGSAEPAPPPPPPPAPSPSSALASPWQAQDVGAVGTAGSASSDNGTFTVRGAGADIWGTADAFHYAWQRLSGDVTVIARVTSVEYVHAWVKAGVMIRERLTGDSPQALMLVSPGKGLAFQRRLDTSGTSTSTSGGAGTAPAWLKLERRANTISAFRSADGVNWTLVGSDSFTMGGDVYVGLVVSSHDPSRLAAATFDNVSVSSGSATTPPPPPPPTADTVAPTATITSPSAGATVNGTVNVAVTASDNVGVTRVEILLDGAVVATDTAAPYQFAWNTAGATNGSHTLRARAVDAAGNTGTSAAVGVTVSNTATLNPEIVLWTSDVQVRAGAWRLVQDSTAAGGIRIHHPDAGAAKLTAPLASPANYFEMTFQAEANRPYRLWIRGLAENNYWPNDSVFVQFNDSVDANGSAIWRIGTSGATEFNLEECSGCGVSGWGWQDNGWGSGVLGPVVYFRTTGLQTIRIQTREDGLSIDQIVLSPVRYNTLSPGPNRNDSTILGKTR